MLTELRITDLGVIAEAVLYAWHQPASVCVREIVLAATRQQP